MKEHKRYKQEPIRTIVKWLEYDTIKFRAFKRDNAALNFQEELVAEGIRPEDIRVVMQ